MDWSKNIDWKAFFEKHGLKQPNKPTVLIVEGPDGAGKTTVINELMEAIKHTFLVHTSAPKKGSIPSYYENVLNKTTELVKALNQPIILDRFHIGEKVYGKLFRKYEIEVDSIDLEMKNLGAKHIYVTADVSTLIHRVDNRGDWYVKTQELQLISAEYDREMYLSNLPLFVLDTTGNVTEEDFVRLLKFILK